MIIRQLLIFLALYLTLSAPTHAVVVADPPSFDGWGLWGEVLIGETRTGTITLRNEGVADAELTGIVLTYSSPPGFSIQTVALPHTLAPAEETIIDVTYTPTFDSMTMGQVRVDVADENSLYIDLLAFAMFASTETSCDDGLDNDGNGYTDCDDPVCQALPICIDNPFIATPSEISFRDVVAGTFDSHEVAVAIYNASEVPVSITEFSLSNPTDFNYEADPNCAGELAAGQTCWVYITFDPHVPGEYAAEFIVDFSTGANTGSFVIPLDGTGIPAGDIEVSPTAHDFGYQYPKSDPIRIAVKNISTNPITLRNIARTNIAFDISDSSSAACFSGLELAGGETCFIDVSFGPGVELIEPGSEVTGQIIITAIDPDGPNTVVDLVGRVPSGPWVVETLKDPDGNPIQVNGLDLARDSGTAHLCYYTDNMIGYANSRPNLSPDWQFEDIEIMPAGSKVIDCAIALMEGDTSPEIAYLVDDGSYLRIRHTDLSQPQISEIDDIYYDWEIGGYKLEHAEITLAKDSFDRTHIAFAMESDLQEKFNGQITKLGPTIPWSRSITKFWEQDNTLNPYMSPHPFIGVTNNGDILLVFSGEGKPTVMRGSNFHPHPDTGDYQWDWQEVDFYMTAGDDAFMDHAVQRFAFSASQYLSIATHNPSFSFDKGIVLDSRAYLEVSNEMARDPYSFCDRYMALGFGVEEASHSLSFEEISLATDFLSNEHVIFDDSASSTVRYVSLMTGQELVEISNTRSCDQPIQYSETVGPGGHDLKIVTGPYASQTTVPYVAYITGAGEVVFAKRVLPPVLLVDVGYSSTLSPMREVYGLGPFGTLEHVIMLGIPFSIGTGASIDANNVTLTTEPIDEGKWSFRYCGTDGDGINEEGYYFVDDGKAIPFCISLESTPFNPVAYFQVTTNGGKTISSTLIADEILDTDTDGVSNLLEFTYGTDPFDADMDNDGLMDGPKFSEDLNANGMFDPGETDPRQPDTDGDGLNDGLEKGLIEPQTPDTDITAGFFIPDADPATQTDPTKVDTDGDELQDGEEDANHNGAFEPELGETNPGLADTDGDGVNDKQDLCPNDPNKTEPGNLGCGIPEDVDVTPPSINLTVSPDTLWPVDHKMVLITVVVTVTDDMDPNPTVVLTSITANEGDDMLGDGSTLGDIVVDESGDIYLRAERSGTGTGRFYTLTYTATDASGNTATVIATVTVPHNQ